MRRVTSLLLNLSSREISSSGQMHVWRRGFARTCSESLGASQTSFSDLKITKNVWRPGSARTRWGSLSAPPGPLAQWVPWKGTFKPQYGRFAARKGVESTLDEAQMNEKGYFEIYHRERFSLQVKMHVWRPGFARTC